MNIRFQLIKLISHLLKKERDPGRAARTYREFDLERGYGAYHQACQACFSRPERPPAGGRLQQQGFEYMDVLSGNQAQDLIQQVTTSHACTYIKKGTKNLEGYHLTDRALIKNILSLILGEKVDDRLISFFGSEYLVHWLAFSRTPPAEEQKSVSFRWHCDKGPSTHLKLIVYLNASAEHGGNTEFICLADTSDVGAKGYLFGWTRARSGDIAHLARIAGHQIQAHRKDMHPGEGVLFPPATVLHRGVSPTRDPRYTITLCLLPSPVHWQEALDCDTMSDLAVDAAWHRHADQLMQKIDTQRAA